MRRTHFPKLIISFLLLVISTGADGCQEDEQYELDFQIDVAENDTESVEKLSSITATELDDLKGKFEAYMEELSDNYFEAANLNTSIDSEAEVSGWNISLIPNKSSSSGDLSFRGKVVYKMLLTAENNASTSSLQNYYTSLFDEIGFDHKDDVAVRIKQWEDLMDTSANVTVTNVVQVPSRGPTCAPAGPTFPTRLPKPVGSSGVYELEFTSCFVEERPEDVFNDTGPICFSMDRLSTDMSRSPSFNHQYTDLIKKQCDAGKPTSQKFANPLPAAGESRQLIPVEFGEEFDLKEASQEDEDVPSVNLRGANLYRDLELEIELNNTLIFNTSLTCYKVRFEIKMDWESEYYANVSLYSTSFPVYVSSSDNLEGLGVFLAREYNLEQNLKDMTFTSEPTNKPTASPAPTLAPSLSPANLTFPHQLNTSSIAPSLFPAPNPSERTEFDGAIIGVIVVAFVAIIIAGVLIWLHVKRLQTKLDNAIAADPNAPHSAPIMQHKSSAMMMPNIDPSTNNGVPEGSAMLPTPDAAEAGSVQRPTTAATSTNLVPPGQIDDPSATPAPMRADSVTDALHSSGILSNRTSVDSWANSTSTANTISQDNFVMPVMTVNDLSGSNMDEAAAAEKYKQGFLSFLPSVDEDPRRLTTLSSDEFDQFKDQNLEKMRKSIEGNVAGVNGMLSLAMTKALMESGTSESRIPTDMTGAEIEANSLWEVSEWVRQNENASDYKRREYMQKLLNKMVMCVRAGVVDPEDGSRSIHSCAALLGLQLAQAPPQTVIILTGMLKTTTDDDVQGAFSQFGPIEGAAVATGEKGFGVVRFRSPKSAVRAMEVFRTSEVVLNNVAIQLTPLS